MNVAPTPKAQLTQKDCKPGKIWKEKPQDDNTYKCNEIWLYSPLQKWFPLHLLLPTTSYSCFQYSFSLGKDGILSCHPLWQKLLSMEN